MYRLALSTLIAMAALCLAPASATSSTVCAVHARAMFNPCATLDTARMEDQP